MFPSKEDHGEGYRFPPEHHEHEATWLQWPHAPYTKKEVPKLEKIWIQMAKHLSTCEKVRVIVKDKSHEEHVSQLLNGVPNVEYFQWKTDDVWARDNGPIFAIDSKGKLVVQAWGFNGWGEKFPYKDSAKIPKKVAAALGLQLVDVRQEMVLEGGSVETDGHGTLMACQSSVLNNNRNPGLTKKDANDVFKFYYGVNNIIWLRGVPNIDITDMHIDGLVKFVDETTLITMSKEDLLENLVLEEDIDRIYSAKNSKGEPFKIVTLPITKKLIKEKTEKEEINGIYVNFYVANKVVLVPTFDDVNDRAALEIIQELYPERKVIGIECSELYGWGGIIHCVTQQQPKI